MSGGHADLSESQTVYVISTQDEEHRGFVPARSDEPTAVQGTKMSKNTEYRSVAGSDGALSHSVRGDGGSETT